MMPIPRIGVRSGTAIAAMSFLFASGALAEGHAQSPPAFELDVEVGPVWQTRNDVQIPNTGAGTRFSLVDVVGNGPWPAARLRARWNINDRHALRLLLAPLSITETGPLPAPVSFAGEDFQTGEPVIGTYEFNSWRVGYGYRFLRRSNLWISVGFTAKLRDAKIELQQGETSAEDTDLGFVPLLHLAGDWRFAPRAHLLFDFDGLAGGPGRAFDTGLKLAYALNEYVTAACGYRTLEGGADVSSVYAFAWLHYLVFAAVFRL